MPTLRACVAKEAKLRIKSVRSASSRLPPLGSSFDRCAATIRSDSTGRRERHSRRRGEELRLSDLARTTTCASLRQPSRLAIEPAAGCRPTPGASSRQCRASRFETASTRANSLSTTSRRGSGFSSPFRDAQASTSASPLPNPPRTRSAMNFGSAPPALVVPAPNSSPCATSSVADDQGQMRAGAALRQRAVGRHRPSLRRSRVSLRAALPGRF